MEIAKWITWAVVLFFAVSWTYGAVRYEQYRLKATIVSMALWWIEIFISATGAFLVFHLIWLMPLSLMVPLPISSAEQIQNPPGSVTRMLIKSAAVMALPVAVLLWW
jgi:hypothetical protein